MNPKRIVTVVGCHAEGEVGDVITEAGGRRVLSPKDLESALSVADQEQGVLLLLERDGQKTFAIFKP